MRLHDDLEAVEARRRPVGGREQFGERARGPRDRLGARVAREQGDEVGPEHGGAGRFQPDDRDASGRRLGELVEQVAENPFRSAQLPGGDPGEAAADRRGRGDDLVAGRFEHRDGIQGDGGGEVVGERVHPQQHLASGRSGHRWARVAAGERSLREARKRAPPVHAAGQQHQPPDRPDREQPVGETRHRRDETRPARQPAQQVMARGPQAMLVRAMQRLRLVLGHVHAGRAVARTGLARQAEVECVSDLRRPPPAGDECAVGHLLQHPCAAARRILLIAGREERRAHHAARTRVVGTAAADTDAAVDRRREVAAVMLEGEAVRGQQRQRGGSPQVRIDRRRLHCRRRVHDHARVQQVAGVEHGLEFREGG